jgi:hypothetical protein
MDLHGLFQGHAYFHNVLKLVSTHASFKIKENMRIRHKRVGVLYFIVIRYALIGPDE